LRPPTPPAVLLQIAQDLKAGMGRSEAAKKNNVHETTVDRVRHMEKEEPEEWKKRTALVTADGITLPPPDPISQHKGTKYAHLRPQVQALKEQKFGLSEIAQKLNIPVSAVNYYYYGKTKKENRDERTESQNGRFDTKFLIGYACAEIDRTIELISQRLGISANLVRSGLLKFLGSSSLR
jgi:hypothetical protein